MATLLGTLQPDVEAFYQAAIKFRLTVEGYALEGEFWTKTVAGHKISVRNNPHLHFIVQDSQRNLGIWISDNCIKVDCGYSFEQKRKKTRRQRLHEFFLRHFAPGKLAEQEKAKEDARDEVYRLRWKVIPSLPKISLEGGAITLLEVEYEDYNCIGLYMLHHVLYRTSQEAELLPRLLTYEDHMIEPAKMEAIKYRHMVV